jgi:hypothetical protein
MADQVVPLGFMPGFGDGAGFGYDSPNLVWLLEAAAARLRVPEYRWLARRIRVFNDTRAVDERPAVDSWQRELRGLARAVLAVDPDLEPRPPDAARSILTSRHVAEPRSAPTSTGPPVYASLRKERVPERLVLRSGPGPDDMVAVFSLLAGYRHGHDAIGSLGLLAQDGSVLASETGFPYSRHQASAQDESAPLVERYWGGRPAPPGRSVEVDRLDEGDHVSVAWLSWSDSTGWGVRQSRRIYLIKNRALWIRDRFDVPSGMTAAIGTAWHAAAVREAGAPGRFEISQPYLFRNVWRYRNPEHYALVALVPPEGGVAVAEYRSAYAPDPSCDPAMLAASPIPAACRFSPPWVLHQHRVAGPGDPGPLVFDTVIVPHPAATASSPEEAPVVDVDRFESGGTRIDLRIAGERWVLFERAPGTLPESAPIETDGDYFIAEIAHPKRAYVAASGASSVWIDSFRWAFTTRAFCETTGSAPCELR